MKVPVVKFELQLQPTPQLEQCQIWATSVTYTAACSNTRSLTHWGRPGIQPTSSWTLCKLLNLLSHTGTPVYSFKSYFLLRKLNLWLQKALVLHWLPSVFGSPKVLSTHYDLARWVHCSLLGIDHMKKSSSGPCRVPLPAFLLHLLSISYFG